MKWSLFTGCLLLGAWHAGVAASASYVTPTDSDAWQAHTSVFECRLEHSVPYYGDAVFRTRAGERSGFFLRAKSSRFAAGEARLLSELPVWFNPDPDQAVTKLGEVPIKRGRWPLWLDSQWTERMLAELNDGRQVTIEQQTWYHKDSAQPARLGLSSVGFRRQYQQYLDCLSGLLPANFDQLKRTALYFEPGETDELNARVQRELDNILKLVKHDNKVRRFYVDGHTDSAGDRADNLELSKQRAELVADYLKRRGIPEDWIVLRWHGERYPVTSNASASGRAQNRRVTVRLEKVEEIEVLPLADATDKSGKDQDNGEATE